jgi:glutathione synthase
MRIAFQIDPIETLVTQTDTTFALMLEAQNRDHEIWVCEPKNLFFFDGTLKVRATRIRVEDKRDSYFLVIDSATMPVADFDVFLVRQDPPFDMQYMANTLLLDAASRRTLILNSPASIRNVSEKLSTLHLWRHVPPTFIGSDKQAIAEFASKYQEVVVKPLFLSGGRMVFRSHVNDENFTKYVQTVADAEHGMVIVQQFLPGVMTNDKRVIFIDGDAMAVLGRRPKQGEFRANVHAGGAAVPAELTAGEQIICADVSVYLKESDVFLAGVDLIDGYLTEINVTSPTLMRELKAMGGPDLAVAFWDKAERKAADRRAV